MKKLKHPQRLKFCPNGCRCSVCWENLVLIQRSHYCPRCKQLRPGRIGCCYSGGKGAAIQAERSTNSITFLSTLAGLRNAKLCQNGTQVLEH